VYKAWAVSLARHLVPLLAAPHAKSPPGEPVAGPLEVRRRLAALEDLAILYTPPEARFTRSVRRARDLFGTEGAVFSLLTDQHQWNKAMIGFAVTGFPIEESFCATTIKTAGPFVVEDAWADPRIAFNTFIRFYAGCPITSPDGTRVGALCVFDANPRNASTIDTTFLEELARDISHELTLPPTRPLAPAA
jgi:GAF domain-containing protein